MRIKKLPSKKQVRKYAEGGVIEGPSHEEGGVPAVDAQSGAEVAEVEGGERIFSTQDTQAMEQVAGQIMEIQEKSPQKADQLAKELGYMIVEMMMKQEQNQALQDAGMGGEQDPMAAQDAEMANSFAMSEE